MPRTRKPHRSMNPYCNYTFRVLWDGQVVAGVSRVSALKRSTEVVEYRDGGHPDTTQKLPGRTKYDAITLERGVSHDSTFEAWANQVAGGTAPAAQVRKDVRIEVCDTAGRLVLAYKVHRCWPSEFVAIKELETNPGCCLIQCLTLQHEGWEIDTAARARPQRRRASR
jgi:phage tail-like protein